MDFVALLEQGQTGADGIVPVQVDEAVKTGADATEEPPPLAARPRRPPCPLAVGQQGSGDGAAARSGQLSAVETEVHQRRARR